MGRAHEKGNTGEDEDGRKGGVQRPRAAVLASERHGDCAEGRGRRRQLPLGLRRARKGRYEARVSWDRGDFRDFGEVSEFSGEGLSGLIAGNSRGSRGGNRAVLLRRVSPVHFRGEIGARSRDFPRLNRDLRVGGLRERAREGFLRSGP
ncbi:hypothetical protein CRG98_038282 [Punica granatum]|uniref:Uncharacterized protein n=1 Tax=Punica granatum TaxID=22663 RepID=A0A2I0IBG0_PUNGR|nr:hypothetical protein CRG98_038282 [Punica granatum]